MPSFLDIASALTLPACCMRKNPTPREQLKEDLRMLGISFSLYLISYWYGFHSLCLLSMATMNILTFQSGISFHKAYSKTTHLNEFEELDSSMEADDDDDKSDYLSLKQRQQGATSSKALTEEQEEKLNQQLQRVVEETNLRNRKRAGMTSARTPSSTTLVEDAVHPPVPPSDAEDDYKDMPPLVSQEEEANPVIKKPTSQTLVWSDVPNFSQTHYLHNYMEDID
jgi:hypothetical protein